MITTTVYTCNYPRSTIPHSPHPSSLPHDNDDDVSHHAHTSWQSLLRHTGFLSGGGGGGHTDRERARARGREREREGERDDGWSHEREAATQYMEMYAMCTTTTTTTRTRRRKKRKREKDAWCSRTCSSVIIFFFIIIDIGLRWRNAPRRDASALA